MPEKTLESPLDCKKLKGGSPEGINPEYSLEGWMLKLQYRCWPPDMNSEKTLLLGKI